MQTLADIHTLLHTPAHTYEHPPTLRTPAHTHAHPCLPTRTHTHARAHPHPPTVVVELIVVVVDEFELINHM